jgi:O-antigen ligase/tetratricopeptide (TPR) repeat protein
MSKEHLLKSIKIILFIIVLGTPLFYFSKSVYPYSLSKTFFFQSCVEILFFLWLYLALIDRRYRPTFTPLFKALAIFLGILTVTAILGVDPWRSFWSTEGRAIGIIAFYHFAVFALVISSLKNEIPWKSILYTSMGTASSISALAFLQLRFPSLLLQAEPVLSRPGSTLGNPTFLAGYLLFHVFIGLYFVFRHVLSRESGKFGLAGLLKTLIFLAALAINTYAVFLTQTRGAILALAAGIFFLLILFGIEPPASKFGFLEKRKLYAAICIIILIAGAGFWLTRSSAVWDKIPGINRFKNISFSSEDTSLGGIAPRLIAFKAAWKGFSERPFLGWGWDNFNIVFNKYYDPKVLGVSYGETRFDKPHNFILEYLVVGGLPALLAYAAVFGFFIWESWKIKNRVFGKMVVAALAVYFTNNLFVFETIGPLIMWFLFIGLIDGLYRGDQENIVGGESKHERQITVSNKNFAGIVLAVAAVGLVYFINFLPSKAAYYQYQGFNYYDYKNYDNKNPLRSILNFKEALRIWSPYNWNIKRDYALVTAEMYFYNPEIVPRGEVRQAIRAMEEVAAEHPKDAYNHYALVDMYNQVSNIDPLNILPAAEREAQIALQLSPDRQEVYFSLAKTKHLLGDNATALELLEKALTLNPKVPDAHFYYGLIAFADNKPDLGYKEIKQAIELGRKWKTADEPRVVANFFADSGHLTEAVDLYKASLVLDPNSLETKVKLGIAYYFLGQKEAAARYILEVAKEFDFKTSPSYNELKPIFEDLGLTDLLK